MASQYPIPSTRVISPSPTPSDKDKDSYFGPASASIRLSSPETISEDAEDNSDHSDPELARARARSRSPNITRSTAVPIASGRPVRRKVDSVKIQGNGETDGLLSPKSAFAGMGARYWRELSRSPSPLGLIPIHREWRTFIHKHEIPRKALHVSIGFVVLWLFAKGVQPSDVHPVLLAALIPIFLTDFVRLHYAPFNDIYIRYLGAFMREAEAHDRYNGVISYLFGAWAVMYFCPKDVAGMSVILLSWCDTAASTFGRLYGRYTPRIRKGKSLAGSLAAFLVGVLTAAFFYGVMTPRVPQSYSTGANNFAFDGHLTLPELMRDQFGLNNSQATVHGVLALAIVSVVCGLTASLSEAIDIMSLDDNLTIPILCGLGLSTFYKYFA